MVPWFSPFTTLHQAEAAFQINFPSLKPLLTILIWSKDNKSHYVWHIKSTDLLLVALNMDQVKNASVGKEGLSLGSVLIMGAG